MPPFLLELLSAALPALGAAGAGFLGRQESQETPIQAQQRQVIDQLLGSLSGSGPFSHLFQADDEAFQKSFVDPARSRFENVTSPQIQQQFIASGQHKGTGLEDTLTRAGVDMDTLLNQQFGQFQSDALNRQIQALTGILGQGAGAAPAQSGGSAALQGLAGFLKTDDFGSSINDILKSFSGGNKPLASGRVSGSLEPRRGHA